MVGAAFKALADLVSAELRAVLFRAIGLTALLFAATLVIVEVLVNYLVTFSWPWADWVLAIGSGVVLVIAFFFLMSPVTAAFAGLFLDDVAARVERKHYPQDDPGVPLSKWPALWAGLRFAVLVLAVNLAILPMILFGVGAILLVAVNAYLVSREYFEMVAMRHMPVEDARQLRKRNSPAVFVSGLIPALLSLVPLLNLVVPLYSTAYFVHVFKRVRVSSA